MPITVITGARTGIGRYLAEHYLDAGHRVIGCSRNPAQIDNSMYEHLLLDVADESAVSTVFGDIRNRYGRVDNLINNAGIASMNHFLLTPVSRVRKIMDTNLIGTFACSQEAAKLMQQQGYGRIVNFSSIAVPLHLAGEAAYVASKSAISSLTSVLAHELGRYGITVNAVGPVALETKLTDGVPERKLEELKSRQAVCRTGTFADVSNVVDFFLQRSSDMITGQTIYLGGVS